MSLGVSSHVEEGPPSRFFFVEAVSFLHTVLRDCHPFGSSGWVRSIELRYIVSVASTGVFTGTWSGIFSRSSRDILLIRSSITLSFFPMATSRSLIILSCWSTIACFFAKSFLCSCASTRRHAISDAWSKVRLLVSFTVRVGPLPEGRASVGFFPCVASQGSDGPAVVSLSLCPAPFLESLFVSLCPPLGNFVAAALAAPRVIGVLGDLPFTFIVSLIALARLSLLFCLVFTIFSKKKLFLRSSVRFLSSIDFVRLCRLSTAQT